MLHRLKRRKPRTLRLETLEPRHMMAGLTATLGGTGVLTVNGTSGNDSIIFRQTNNQVSIDGLTTKYATAAVKSIVVNLNGGNDTVRLDGGGAHGQQALAVPV